MRALKTLADRHGLRIIEDAAHCIEGKRDGIRPGELSDAACFSFYATKNLTCGEGGAITVNDDALAERLKLLRLHGMTRMAQRSAREGYRHWDMVVNSFRVFGGHDISRALEKIDHFGFVLPKLTASSCGYRGGLRFPLKASDKN
jgi:dTDP-4-amino-4,6-dideoxygalactose transaminase